MADYLGKSIPRFDLIDKVTGKAKYSTDFQFDNQLYMAIRFAERPHAVIKNLDISKAQSQKGVIAVFTAKDVPNNEYGLIMPDQPVLCGPGSSKPFADHVRFFGDQVAIVIAENSSIAKKAAKLIEIEYEDLPVVKNANEAIKKESALVHPDRDSNILLHYKIRKGEIDDAFNKCDVIVESDYTTPVQEHAFLQPEAGIGYMDFEDRITVIVGGQWTHEDQEQIAHALNVPLEKIRVIYPAIGGAFGGREDMSVQIILALAVMKLDEMGIRRPIKISWKREESFFGHHKRHPYYIHAKWGATNEGKILAAEMKLIADCGAYAYTSTKVQGNATLLATGPYEIPSVKIDSYSVYTNNIPNGAFRGFGGPQSCYAAEMQVNKLAHALNIDSVELRLKNAINEDIPFSVRTPLPKGITISNVIKDCAKKANWKNERSKKKTKNDLLNGIGFAAGFKNVGFSFGAPEQCWAIIELQGETEIEKAIVKHAGAEVGQGSHSLFKQFAATSLGIDIEKIELIASDTATSKNSGSASASRLSFMAGNSIIGAAELALEKWKSEERPAIAEYRYVPPKTTPFDPETGECFPNFAYGYAAEAIFVEVDKSTGELTVKKVVVSDDVGKAINPAQVKGQIEGAVVQALGYSLMENFIQKDGIVQTKGFSTYLLPTIKDIPEEMIISVLEIPDPIGPAGARGLGEMPYLPVAPALCDAIHDATGVWIDEFPFNQETILRGIGEL